MHNVYCSPAITIATHHVLAVILNLIRETDDRTMHKKIYPQTDALAVQTNGL